MSNRWRRVVRTWSHEEEDLARRPRHGLVREEQLDDGTFVQREGPFADYERRVGRDGPGIVDTTRYRLTIPWFGWVFALPVRLHLRQRPRAADRPPPWAAPDRLSAHHVLVLGLVAAASMSGAFVNTLFTQTVNFAADGFGISERSQGVAGVIVRCGIVLALPLLVLADRIGRRRVIVGLAWAAPICSALGALSPNFWVLTASQAVGRPLGISLDILIAVVAAEAMPRNSRAYALSLLAMASGLGAGVAVGSLPLADIGSDGWRFVYVVSIVWLLVAIDLTRRLPETPRFDALLTARREHGPVPARVRGRRFAALAGVGFAANLFVAPASYFQNRYLDDVRGYSGAGIAVFTLVTATPASVGLIVGGRLADTTGRRRILAIALPSSTAAVALAFMVGGPVMWLGAFLGGLCGGIAYPAYNVYRSELFPTARRGEIGGLLSAAALIGGSIGLVVAGVLVDRGWSYGSVMAMLGAGQLIASVVIVLTYPETAHRALEELNPDDAALLST